MTVAVHQAQHVHVWSRSTSGLTRICDGLGCGEVQSVIQDGYLTAFSGSFEERVNPYTDPEATVHLDHVLCGECEPGSYICGTPRDLESEQVVAMGAPLTFTACAVCFASTSARCNACGVTIKVEVPA